MPIGSLYEMHTRKTTFSVDLSDGSKEVFSHSAVVRNLQSVFMFKRYWLITFPENRFGPKNLGLTALSAVQAKTLAKQELRRLGWQQISEEDVDKAEVIEDIDVRDLDQNHVIPNMGVASRQGMWFPNCNS